MKAETYRFKIGAFHCLAVSDGTFVYPPAMVFVNAPKEEYEEALREHHLPLDEIKTPYICLYLDTGEHRVLVDTGAGKLAPTTGRLIENLRSEGIDSRSIDTVILTHAHPDHVGGNFDSNGNLAFPNARYVMSRDEWNFWTLQPDLSSLKCDDHLKHLMLQYAADMLPPIRHRLDLVDGETEVVPGVRTVAAPGHTPGHLAIEISSQGEALIDAVDAILHPVLIERATEAGTAIMAFHFPFPGLGRVVRKEKGFNYKPTG